MRTAITLKDQQAIVSDFKGAPGKPLGDFTLTCWLKTSGHGTLFFHDSLSQGTYFTVDITAAGRLVVSGLNPKGGLQVQSVIGNINDGEWHHLGIVFEAGKLALWVEGKNVPTQQLEAPKSPKSGVEGVWIGMDATASKYLAAEVGDVAVWGRALKQAELEALLLESPVGTEPGLLMYEGFGVSAGKANARLAPGTPMLMTQTVKVTVFNDSPYDFELKAASGNVGAQLPKFLPANKETEFRLVPGERSIDMSAKGAYVPSTKTKIPSNLAIDIFKSVTKPYQSYLKAPVDQGLERDIEVQTSTIETFEVTLRISLNLVIVNALNVTRFVEALGKIIGREKILTNMNYNFATGGITSTDAQLIDFYQASQLFNRRIQEVPAAIVGCTSVADVQATYMKARDFNLPVSVRSGGHDHEGESSGTNTVLIDMMGLKGVDFAPADTKEIAEIASGNRFITLTTALANQGVMIPHGTCATVALPGFIMGGGWGPWTRMMGMSCERLVGADIVLGNGDFVKARPDKHSDLLWALKGGGGLSYGIVTKFYVKTFPLPEKIIKFELEWNPYPSVGEDPQPDLPTLQVLQAWEAVIGTVYLDPDSKTNPHNLALRPHKPNASQLSGTNLKVNGKPRMVIAQHADGSPVYETIDPKTVSHNCVMYGYWVGNEVELREFVKEVFEDKGVPPADMRVDGVGGLGNSYGDQLGDSWGRESYINVQLKAQGKEGLPYPPDLDEPAPHKITSRLVEKQGLQDEGHAALMHSLTSALILPGNRTLGLFQYVTLGAIVGDFYANLSEEHKKMSAFPYKDCRYTIQYQTWWNTDLQRKEKLENNPVYTRSNRALDWMEVSRDFVIPNTSGAFISFKDSSIPTKTYFGASYAKLVEIKKDYALDKYNHLRSRKTII